MPDGSATPLRSSRLSQLVNVIGPTVGLPAVALLAALLGEVEGVEDGGGERAAPCPLTVAEQPASRLPVTAAAAIRARRRDSRRGLR